jgi:hypothetical protein
MSGETVKVVVRCRPMNQRETSMKCKTVVSMDSARGVSRINHHIKQHLFAAQCTIVNPSESNSQPKPFTFDGVYFVDSIAEQVYNDIVYPLVEVCVYTLRHTAVSQLHSRHMTIATISCYIFVKC